MKLLRVVVLFFLTTIILTACSSNTTSLNSNDVKKIVDNINFQALNKLEYVEKNNTLNIEITEEFIDKVSFETVINKLSYMDKKGLSAFEKINFDNKEFNIKILSKKNSVSLNTTAPTNYTLDIQEALYTEDYLKKLINDISKEVISFNDLVGRIQIDLKKGTVDNERVQKLKEQAKVLTEKITYFDNIKDKVVAFDNLAFYEKEIKKIANLSSLIFKDVDNAINNKNALIIEAHVLNINELDKIAREIIK